MTATLHDRRAALELEIEGMIAQQGAALLDGQDFDASTIATRKAELAAIEAAEAETHRRNRLAQAQDIAKDRDHARAETGLELERYLSALKRVEGHAKGLTDDLRIIQSAAFNLQALCRRMGFPGAGFTVDPSMTASTVSDLLASELQKIGGRCYYGHMRWPSVPLNPDWSAHGRLISTAITPLVQGE